MSSINFIVTLIFLSLAIMVHSNILDGKILINLGQQRGFLEGDLKPPPSSKLRNGILKSKRWTKGIVPYTIEPDNYTQEHFDLIEEGMRTIEKHTCIRFVKRTNEVNNLVIRNGAGGCFSTSVGMQGGTQVVNLRDQNGYSCFSKSTIVHELFHAIGLHHEQSRYDRDQYLHIHTERLKANDTSAHFQLRLVNESESSDYGIPYNYASVMHYDAWAMGDGSAGFFIMEPKQPGMLSVMGFAESANETDWEKVRRIYDCKGKYPVQPDRSGPCEDNYDDCNETGDLCDLELGVVRNCRKSCGYCEWGKQIVVTPKPFCEDYRTDCDRYAELGKCQTEKWMKLKCAWSCGFCDTSKTRNPTKATTPAPKPAPPKPPTQPKPLTPPAPKPCEDTITYCKDYQAKCQEEIAWMQYDCRKTCNFC